MNAQTTLNQIGPMTLMALAARDFLKDGANRLIFRVGPKSKLAKVVISLDASDTYTVRYVELSKKTYATTRDEEQSFVYADQLSATLRALTGC